MITNPNFWIFESVEPDAVDLWHFSYEFSLGQIVKTWTIIIFAPSGFKDIEIRKIYCGIIGTSPDCRIKLSVRFWIGSEGFEIDFWKPHVLLNIYFKFHGWISPHLLFSLLKTNRIMTYLEHLVREDKQVIFPG